MVKCVKCENETKSVLDNIPEERTAETMHRYLQEGAKFEYGEFLAKPSVEISQHVMLHAGSQVIVYHGGLCERCLDDLCEKGIVTTEEES